MTIEDQIRDEKLQYDINRESAKVLTLSSGKIDKYEYLTGEEILPSNQLQIIEDQGKKQIDALEDLKPKEIKPRKSKPDEYGDYFLDDFAKIRDSYEPVDFCDVTYNFTDSRIP